MNFSRTLSTHYFSKDTGREGLGTVNCHIVGAMNFKSTEATGVLVLNPAVCFYRTGSKRIFFLVFNSLVKMIKH